MLLIFQSHGWAGVLNGVGCCCSSGGCWRRHNLPQLPPVSPATQVTWPRGPSLETKLYILGLDIKTGCRGRRANSEHKLWKWFKKRATCHRSTVSLQTQVTWPSKKSDLIYCAKIAQWQSLCPIYLSVLLKIVPEWPLSNWRNHFFFKTVPIGGRQCSLFLKMQCFPILKKNRRCLKNSKHCAHSAYYAMCFITSIKHSKGCSKPLCGTVSL